MSFKGKELLKIACLEVLKMGEWFIERVQEVRHIFIGLEADEVN